MTWTLLVPVDLHEKRPAWLDHAQRLAVALEARVILLHVVDYLAVAHPGELPDGFPIPPLRLMAQPAEERLEELAATLEGVDVEVAVTARAVSAAEAIVAAAEQHGADEIVIGSHSRKGLARMILGSVAERVARLATCPVTIVPAAHD